MSHVAPQFFGGNEQGIAISSQVGIADMRNIDISTDPGLAKISLKTRKTAGPLGAIPRFEVQVPRQFGAGQFLVDSNMSFVLLSNNQVYRATFGGGFQNVTGSRKVTEGFGDGMVWWKDHLFCFRDKAIDVYKVETGQWFNDWGGYVLESGAGIDGTFGYHPGIASINDGRLYICHGNKVMRVIENGTFDAGDASTWTADVTRLTLPVEWKIKTVAELAGKLYFGCWQGVGISSVRLAAIFPWNRSDTSYDEPVEIKEYGINQMISDNGTIYFQAGILGNWYETNGAYYRRLISRKATLPKPLLFKTVSALRCEPGAVFIRDGKIYFGVSICTPWFDSSTQGREILTTVEPMGVWSIDIETGALVFENQISTGNMKNLNIGVLRPISEAGYTIGWHDFTADEFGFDVVDETLRYVSTETTPVGTIEYDWRTVGNKKKPESYTEAEPIFTEPLQTGEGLLLYARKVLNGTWELLGKFTAQSAQDIFDISLVDVYQLQIKVALLGNGTTPKFKGIYLR